MTVKRFSIVIAILCALFSLAQAQTPRLTTVNITPDADKVGVSAIGDVSEMRIEVSDEQGDVVFQSGAITGNALDWNMTNAQGERVSAGTYLVTVTFRTAAGKLRKRVEQVTVAEDEKAGTQSTSAPNAVQAVINGTGTNGKIAKFTGAATIANSVITESAGKIGIGVAAPTSTLTVAGMIQTTGATGGIKFADNSVQTKAGINAVAHNTTLSGSGTTAFPLTVANLGVGNAQLANNAVTATKIAANSVTATHIAAGQVVKSVNGLKDNVTLTAGANVTITPTGNTLKIASTGGMTQWTTSGSNIFYNTGNVGIGTTSPLVKLHVEGATTAASQLPVLVGINTSSGIGVVGKSTSGDAVRGESDTSGSGVRGKSVSGNGVRGISNSGEGVHGESTSGMGVYGTSTSGEAGHFDGKVKVVGDLEATTVKVNGALMATGKVTGTGGLIGVEGNSASGEGVHGESASGAGVKGVTTSGIGVLGTSSGSGEAGHFDGKVKVNGNLEATFGAQVAGNLEAGSVTVNGNLEATGGVNGSGGAGDIGVLGTSTGSGDGVHGDSTSGTGVKGISDSGPGVHGGSTSGRGVWGQSVSGEAGHFDGQVGIVGTLTVAGGVTITGSLTVGNGCTGCSSFQSDRNLKANLSSISPRFILDRLASIPIQTWNYKSQPTSVRHIGAMAQDFRAAFGFGENDTTINTVDTSGVTMAAIQGLYQMMQEKEERNLELAREVEELRARLARLENERAAEKR